MSYQRTHSGVSAPSRSQNFAYSFSSSSSSAATASSLPHSHLTTNHPASSMLSSTPYFLHSLNTLHASSASSSSSPSAAAAAPSSYLSLMRRAPADSASSTTLYHPQLISSSTRSSTSTSTPFIALHMDDIDEEIQALGFTKAMVAGASAGVAEHFVMFPVDTIKTRLMQVDGMKYRNVVDAMSRIIREEGPQRLYRGFIPTVSGAIPSHAAHYGVYEYMRHRFGGNEPGHHPIINGVSGGLATMAHDAIVTPTDVVKQRLQMSRSQYSGVMHCIKVTYEKEGFRAFYRSYPTTVAMNVPFQAVHFAAYESLKIFFTGEEEEHGVVEEVMAGGAAGALAGFASTPVDVVKTYLQTQEVPVGQKRMGALSIAKQIFSTQGLPGLMKGATARTLYFIPSAAICWSTYETMKRVLKDAW